MTPRQGFGGTFSASETETELLEGDESRGRGCPCRRAGEEMVASRVLLHLNTGSKKRSQRRGNRPCNCTPYEVRSTEYLIGTPYSTGHIGRDLGQSPYPQPLHAECAPGYPVTGNAKSDRPQVHHKGVAFKLECSRMLAILLKNLPWYGIKMGDSGQLIGALPKTSSCAPL